MYKFEMPKTFLGNCYSRNPHMKNNTFLEQTLTDDPLPTYEEAIPYLPRPIWDGHKSALDCYDKAWQLAFKNLRKAKPGTHFVSDFIDTAFNGFLFMWDSTFIMMFAKYGSRVFNFQKTLDNFYSHQHPDGFICRELCEREYGEEFNRDDPCSTGPNVLPWAEWTYYCATGDKERLSRVFDPLSAYHWWMCRNRSWQNGTYWSSGWGCGMDDCPRVPEGYCVSHSHGHMSWLDATAQAYLSNVILCKMAKELGREDETDWLKDEQALLYKAVNETMWDEKTSFYYDVLRDGSRSKVKFAGAYWTLLADLVPEERKDAFVAHLDNENEFKRPNRVPTLSADHPEYCPDGGYWRGAIWAPTNYMILEALRENGYDAMSYDIARACHQNAVEVFEKTGTLWENYAPDLTDAGYCDGHYCKDDFVGWSGVFPIAILFEFVFGIYPDAQNRHIDWNVRVTERHGIENYPLGDATVSLICDARESEDEAPVVHIESDKPITVTLRWKDTVKEIHVG